MAILKPMKKNNLKYDVHLVVRLGKGKRVSRGYFRDIQLPFIPTIGMKFVQGLGCTLWETRNGEINPSVEQVIYDIDEEAIICLFTVDDELTSTFWKPLKDPTKDGHSCAELRAYP